MILLPWLQSLALDAETRVHDANPPLFLRFTNLLINDAIFLLDEAFSVSYTAINYYLHRSDIPLVYTINMSNIFTIYVTNDVLSY